MKNRERKINTKKKVYFIDISFLIKHYKNTNKLDIKIQDNLKNF